MMSNATIVTRPLPTAIIASGPLRGPATCKLLASSGALAKRGGFSATGVDGLMKAIGLTGGAFYGHFASKDALFAAIVERANKVIKQIFETEKYDLILQDVVFAGPRVDITDKVIKALNNGAAR